MQTTRQVTPATLGARAGGVKQSSTLDTVCAKESLPGESRADRCRDRGAEDGVSIPVEVDAVDVARRHVHAGIARRLALGPGANRQPIVVIPDASSRALSCRPLGNERGSR